MSSTTPGKRQRRPQCELRQPLPLSAGGWDVQLCQWAHQPDRPGGVGSGHGAKTAGVRHDRRQLEPGGLAGAGELAAAAPGPGAADVL